MGRCYTREDAGVSVPRVATKRPAFDRLMIAVALWREIDMVAAWAVDRAGRIPDGPVGLLTDLHAMDVDLFSHQQGLEKRPRQSGPLCSRCWVCSPSLERAMIRGA